MPELTAPAPDDLARQAAEEIAQFTGVARHDLAVTLGSGWKGVSEHLGTAVAEIPAQEITGFRISGVHGHTGTLQSILMPNGARVLVLGARTHSYEGYGVASVVHGTRVAAACGVKTIVLTNGAGSLDPGRTMGEPVLIRDHINLTGLSPVFGAKFIDLTDLYSMRLRQIARSLAPELAEAVYVQLNGPHYETPAEVTMLQRLGADAVGMSTALEAIAAREAGLEVLGLSLMTNLAAGLQAGPLDHSEVLDAGKLAEPRLGPLLTRIIFAITEAP